MEFLLRWSRLLTAAAGPRTKRGPTSRTQAITTTITEIAAITQPQTSDDRTRAGRDEEDESDEIMELILAAGLRVVLVGRVERGSTFATSGPKPCVVGGGDMRTPCQSLAARSQHGRPDGKNRCFAAAFSASRNFVRAPRVSPHHSAGGANRTRQRWRCLA